jgi:acetylornithine deacetylase/succinyl-diaminopimelate desuccinylase-like protein
MFNGHLDTSFGNELADRGLGFRAKGTVVDDEWIFGMGAFNMKCALAAYAEAVRALNAAGIRLAGDLVVAGVAGEIEKAPVDDFSGANYLGYGVGTKHLVTHGVVADACILGEPTNMKLVSSHCGSAWTKISIPGELVHTAWSKQDRNAILKARVVLDALERWIDDYRSRHSIGNFSPKVNVAAISGGQAWRGARTPEHCTIYVDIRTLPKIKATDIQAEMRHFVGGLNAETPNLNATVELYLTNPGAEIDHDHDLVGLIAAAHQDQLGIAPEQSMEVWCSDAAHLTRYSIPTVNYGPAGRIRQGGEGWSTALGEHVHIGDLVDITKVYVRAAAAWCGVVR